MRAYNFQRRTAHAAALGTDPVKQIAPRTEAERAIMACPDHWLAYIFPNKRVGERTMICETRDEARACAQRLADHYQRVAIVYAVRDEQRAHAGVVQPKR